MTYIFVCIPYPIFGPVFEIPIPAPCLGPALLNTRRSTSLYPMSPYSNAFALGTKQVE